jgi:diguanylate cyclase
MTAYDPTLSSEKKGVLGWLGFGRSSAETTSELSSLAQQMRTIAPGSRSDQIASIAEFLARHDLDVGVCALAVAFDYVTRSDPLLVRLIDERELIGQPVTIEWLRKLRGQDQDDLGAEELHRTFEKLEKQLIEFGSAASAARKATQDYGESLEGHAEQLGSAQQDLNSSVSQILGVVRSMITRTSEMEKEMSRSERQSRVLRRNLEMALRSAEEDHLTGIPNRRAFEKVFEHEYREARMSFDTLVVAFCDIDHFKRINDTHGHDTGDRVLKAVAKNLSRISSERCFIARHGGEEFVVLFRGQSLEKAREALEGARTELSERRLIDRRTNAPIGYVTFSAGIADVFAYSDRRAALRAADAALYLAKGQGRNQIVTASV